MTFVEVHGRPLMYEIKVNIVAFGDRPHFQMQYRDPVTGRKKTRSTGIEKSSLKKVRLQAERVAAAWEAELQNGTYSDKTKLTWKQFRERYETEKLASLAKGTEDRATAVMNLIEKHLNPQRLEDLTADTLSIFQSKLRTAGQKEATIAGNLAHLRSALSWAKSVKLIRELPQFNMPRRAKGSKLMKGRPITDAEFALMLAAVPSVRPKDSEAWQRYLNGLWLSGLRLEESLLLSWDEEGGLLIDLSGRRPRLRIWAGAEKGNQDRLLPLTPDFAEWLLQTPDSERHGLVFRLPGLLSGKLMTPKRISRVVSAIGEKAGILVNKTEEKYASAHDLRRAFATRWAPRIKPATLRLLMRHESIETTLKYYVDQDADDVADDLWNRHSPIGNSFGNSGRGEVSPQPTVTDAT